jgi:membrane protein implicated in regulation of membrane protease activity
MESIVWLIIFALCIIVEILTLGLTTVWFAVGSLIAFFAALAGLNEWIQIIIFSVVSLLMLFFTKPVVKKYFNKDLLKTNVDSLVGLTAKVMERIDNVNATGSAVLKGQEWMARAENENEVIEAGTFVEVVSISGVKLIVAKKQEE